MLRKEGDSTWREKLSENLSRTTETGRAREEETTKRRSTSSLITGGETDEGGVGKSERRKTSKLVISGTPWPASNRMEEQFRNKIGLSVSGAPAFNGEKVGY